MSIVQRSFFLGIVAAAFSVAGCQDAGTHADEKSGMVEQKKIEQLVEQKVQSNEELIEILQSIRDKESLDQAWPKLLHHHRREQQLREQFKEVARPANEVLAGMQHYAERLAAAKKRHEEEIRRIQQLPEGAAFIEQLKAFSTAEQLRH